jgi:hypothetical protein
MTSEVKITEESKLVTLKKQRAQIQSEIAKLTKKNKNNPEAKAEGRIYYLHGDYRKGFPRVTVAAHLNETKKEMYMGASICSSEDQFVRKTGRLRAMGRAISTKRVITGLKLFDHATVRNKLNVYLKKVELAAYQEAMKRNPKIRNTGRTQLAKRIEVVHYHVGENGKN